MAKNYKIFVSHSWDNSDDLIRLQNLLNSRGYFNVEFKEVTKNEPINSTNATYVKSVLRSKIKESNIVIGLAGIYASYSDWMEWELKTSNDNNIPIIGLKPYGNLKVSSVVKSYSKEIVNWNTESIVAAIKEHAL